MRKCIAFILFITITLTAVSSTKVKIEVPLRFDRYYSYSEVNEALKALNKAFPNLTTLDIVGQSEEGRDIYALTINNPKTGKHTEKPGVYVDGNIHGNEIQAGEVCLYYANLLLTKYGENPRITKAIDKNAHYIIPVVNVDGRFHFFEDANTPSTNRTIRVPRDDDRDGLIDEDPYDDLDGDGNICQMRIKDPFGIYKTDPEDPRLMIRVKKGEKGEWTILGQEGIDNDGDGRINEDTEGYLDPNRNWGYNWKPQYVQSGAGLYPLSGVGLKAINDYIMVRPNIIMAYAFHNNGGMWLRSPSVKSEKIDSRDVAAWDIMGENAIKMTPGYVYKPAYDLYATYGDFDSHMYSLIGAYSFVGELFISSTETYRKDVNKTQAASEGGFGRGSSNERKREQLKFNDHLGIGEMYKDWKTYMHPLYGEIEIGGWVKMTSRLPQLFMLQELVHRNASVVLFSAENTPVVKMEVIETKKLAKNLTQLTVRLSNNNALPSMTYQAGINKLHPKDILSISGAKVVAGGELTDKYLNKVKFKENKPEVQFLIVPSYGKTDYRFIIEGKGEVTINYKSVKAKNSNLTVQL